VSVKSFNNLLEGPDNTVRESSLNPGVSRSRANVVDTLEDDRVSDGGMREDVSVNAGESVGPETVVEDAVPSRSLVDDGERLK
jgi:hypothetical protein